MKRIVYYNGVFSNEDDVGFSPSNRGLLYGDGVFETMRAYQGRIFRLEKHLQRLADGLGVLRIEPWWKSGDLAQVLTGLLAKNNLSDAALRITVCRGDGEGAVPPPQVRAALVISAKPLSSYHHEDYTTGFQVRLVSIRRNIHSPLSRIKSLNYLDNILGRIEAQEYNAQEALFLNTEGFVAEGATSNIFFINNNRLVTAPVDAAILPGITREAVLEIAPAIVQEVAERNFFLKELHAADEAFLTNSIMEIMPVTSINDQPVGAGMPGPITQRFVHHYRKLVNRELGLD